MQGFRSFIGIGIGVGLGLAAWQLAAHTSLRLLAALLWAVFLVWQLTPISVASFQENADLSIFLRFPVTFSSYVAFYIWFGLFDIGSLIGGIALFGIWVGASVAQPHLILWITLAIAIFAAFNILLTRMIFAWIDRWLAQRKTREVLGLIFLFLILALQLLNPALHQRAKRSGNSASHSIFVRNVKALNRVQSKLPPGLAANALASARHGQPIAAAVDLLFVSLFAAAAGIGLAVRLHAEYRGENLGEAPSQVAKAIHSGNDRRLLEGSGPIAAVIEKEIRYLTRSGVMLYGFLAPLIMVFLFSGSRSQSAGFSAQYALPVGVAYSFLGLTRFIYNNLGGEGAGVQLYFLSPTPFSKIMLAKNIVHILVLLVELALVCAIVGIRSGIPDHQILTVTFCWLLFAVPAQLAVGNILSITMPYRQSMTRMTREQGATGNALLSLLVEVVVFAIGAAVYIPLKLTSHTALVAPTLLLLAALSVIFWVRVLSNTGEMVATRKETLVSSLYRAA